VTRRSPNRLVLVLGDQLTQSVAALRAADRKRDVVLLAEVQQEASYVRHHKKKIAFVLSAMRHFADELADDGWRVDYVKLNDQGNSGSIVVEVERALSRHGCGCVLVTKPGEWRLFDALEKLRERLNVDFNILEDDRFLCSGCEFARWANGRKQLRMEHFYREMRRRTGLLMDEHGEPCGGRWNFDTENRKPPKKELVPASPKRFPTDETTQKVLQLVDVWFGDHFGALEPFWFAVTRKQAEAAFDHFVENSLEHFGDYQDAMLLGKPFLYHAVASLYLNVGLLDPLGTCRQVDDAYRMGHISVYAAEGFIRQIIGWREYVRGIYWLEMPDYVHLNFFEHQHPLPDFYWTAQTDMACIRACVEQTRDEAYAHHIQRLMITGNFAMLVGVDPKAVHEWYLAVYADAYEWVELPNTLGMSQFADGGLLGSKPYAAGGNYINRMSDYCSDCHYNVKEKSGPSACPFNYLYWDFLWRHRAKLAGNPRLAHAYRTLDRMDNRRKAEIPLDANRFIQGLRA
jgi:(6-4)DNA photolyase